MVKQPSQLAWLHLFGYSGIWQKGSVGSGEGKGVGWGGGWVR